MLAALDPWYAAIAFPSRGRGCTLTSLAAEVRISQALILSLRQLAARVSTQRAFDRPHLHLPIARNIPIDVLIHPAAASTNKFLPSTIGLNIPEGLPLQSQ